MHGRLLLAWKGEVMSSFAALNSCDKEYQNNILKDENLQYL